MPRKYEDAIVLVHQRLHASMRPGRMPRKYRPWPESSRIPPDRFNEAGADAPEIHDQSLQWDERACTGFNEAGADAPEIQPT